MTRHGPRWAFWSVAAAEFRMQVRRPALWLTLLLAAIGTSLLTRVSWASSALTAHQAVGMWAYSLQMFCPAAFGCLLADRIGRERRLRSDDLLCSLPVRLRDHIAGKYVGSVTATLLPLILAYAAGVGVLATSRGAAVVPQACAAFALINLPGLLFVAAFSIGCPALMPVPLYQFLFVGYWFWGNFLPPGLHIPTLSHTLLTPVGKAALAAFEGGPGPLRAAASVAMLLTAAALALLATVAVLRRRLPD